MDSENSDRATYFETIDSDSEPKAQEVSSFNDSEEENQVEHVDSLFVEWLAPSIHHHHVDHRWRSGVIIILLAMAALSIFWQESFLSAVTFIGIALVASIHFHKEPEHTPIGIHPSGVTIGERTIPYYEMESFWIHYEPGHLKELSILCKNPFHSHIKIHLADQDPVEIRAKLAQYVPEIPHEETFIDILGRKLGL